jgi:AraC-like DNA-binding protein
MKIAFVSGIVPIAAALCSFLALLLATFLVIVPSRTRMANLLLAMFLVATSIDISAWFVAAWWNAHTLISSFRPVLAALQMPLFTAFIWLSCFHQHRLLARDAIHLSPAFYVLAFVMTGNPVPYLLALLELQYLVYIGITIFALWRVDRLLRGRFVSRSPTWRWLALLVATSLLAHGVYLVRTAVSPWLPAALAESMQVIAALLVLVITVWIAFQALLSPALFRGGDRQLASASTAMNDSVDEGADRLAKFMQEQHPYLNPDLSLSRLARQSGIPVKELSGLINQRHGLHFFDFVNRYRIDHAKSLLITTEQSVTEILYASGFNAKSSFNTAFRKHTGITPSAYRQNHAVK